MTFLLCDICDSTADFGKINLKNLKKLQKLDISGDDFAITSGIKPLDAINIKIHDQIAHKKVPPTAKKYLTDQDKIKYKKSVSQLAFLPLANPINQVRKVDVNRYNNDIESMVDNIQGRRGDIRPLAQIGKAIRRRNMSDVEQLATVNSPITSRLLAKPDKPPTKQDLKDLKDWMQKNKKGGQRFEPKTKGAKPTPKTIEEKQSNLKQKYGIA
jgi:hypothetical protein